MLMHLVLLPWTTDGIIPDQLDCDFGSFNPVGSGIKIVLVAPPPQFLLDHGYGAWWVYCPSEKLDEFIQGQPNMVVLERDVESDL